MNYRYIPDAHPTCAQKGCQAPGMTRWLDEASQIMQEWITREESRRMAPEPTRSLWCEAGEGHSFSERAPGWQVISIRGADNVEGESRTLCGPHYESTGIVVSSPAAVGAGVAARI